IHIGGVEKIDSEFERSPDERPAFFFVQKPLPFHHSVAHAAQTDSGHFETGLAKVCVVHSFITPHYCFVSKLRRRSPRRYPLTRKRKVFGAGLLFRSRTRSREAETAKVQT